MKIVFLYPAVKNIPNGGLKIIFEYANLLDEDGYDVSIVYASYFSSIDKSILRLVKSIVKYLYLRLFRERMRCRWFKLNSGVKEFYVWEHTYDKIPKGDCYIATAVTTAPYLNKYPIQSSSKFYFIQDLETFIHHDEEFIKQTYRYPITKIAVSRWLKDIINAEGQDCYVVPNGFDFNEYCLLKPIKERNKYNISMLYHIRDAKDSKLGLKALKIVKDEIPMVTVSLFGVHDSPSNLPTWVKYYKNPSHEEHLRINNEAAIYIGTSKKEGWGLTIGEAMMCGQAVACTDNYGYKEMAINGRNALISPVGDEKELANNIIKLIIDDELRMRIAQNGLEDIRQFDKRISYTKFKNIISDSDEIKHNNN